MHLIHQEGHEDFYSSNIVLQEYSPLPENIRKSLTIDNFLKSAMFVIYYITKLLSTSVHRVPGWVTGSVA